MFKAHLKNTNVKIHPLTGGGQILTGTTCTPSIVCTPGTSRKPTTKGFRLQSVVFS